MSGTSADMASEGRTEAEIEGIVNGAPPTPPSPSAEIPLDDDNDDETTLEHDMRTI